MKSLDVKDRKLLYHLSQNARMSDTQLSKKVGLSKNGVKYRIARLQKEGIINHFATTVDPGKLNMYTYSIILSFNEDVYEKREIIDFFANHDRAIWVITLSGQWDIVAEFIVDAYYQVMNIVDHLIERFGAVINTYKIFSSNKILRDEHLIECLYEDLDLPSPQHPKRESALHTIDAVDRKILYELNQDSSLPYLTIAQKIGSTIDVVRYRMKHLEEKKIILRFFPEISLMHLGYIGYIFVLNLKSTSQDVMTSLLNRLRVNPHISYAFFDHAGFNVFFVCAFKDTDESRVFFN
jgi:Lrp/AsnC family transcriptional regulator, leucine-responsive regulatory protein